jgi:hypothetical protein
LAAEVPAWRYRRIAGEIAGLGRKVSPATVWAILRKAGEVFKSEASTWYSPTHKFPDERDHGTVGGRHPKVIARRPSW